MLDSLIFTFEVSKAANIWEWFENEMQVNSIYKPVLTATYYGPYSLSRDANPPINEPDFNALL